MAPFPSSALLLLLIASASAKTTISFYRRSSCASDVPSSGDAFENDNLATSAGICYMPPDGTIALNIDELDEGCSVTAYLDSTCSMPTSPTLSPLTHPPCFFLSAIDLLGSFAATCSSSTNNNNNDSSATTTAAAAGDLDHPTPGLQSSAANALSLPARPAHVEKPRRWRELGVRALVAMGAVEVVWGWGML